MYVQLNIELSIYFTNIIRAINRHNLNENNVLMYDFQSINVNANESKWNKSVTIRIESKVSISLTKPVSLIISEDYASYRRLYQFCSFNRSDLYSLITAKIGWLCIEHWAQSLKGKKFNIPTIFAEFHGSIWWLPLHFRNWRVSLCVSGKHIHLLVFMMCERALKWHDNN